MPNFKLTRLDGEVSLQMYTSMLQEQGALAGDVRNHASDEARRASDQRTGRRPVLLNLEKDCRGWRF